MDSSANAPVKIEKMVAAKKKQLMAENFRHNMKMEELKKQSSLIQIDLKGNETANAIRQKIFLLTDNEEEKIEVEKLIQAFPNVQADLRIQLKQKELEIEEELELHKSRLSEISNEYTD